MLPQNCSNIHYPISLNLSSKKKQNENGEKSFSFSRSFSDICCFDYLINIEGYYSDNLVHNYFYYQFTRIIYDFDKKNIFDFANYDKDSLIKFIIILNKACCFYYIQDKIKYSKYLSNLSVSILQNYLKKHLINKSAQKTNITINELKNNDIIYNIYNNAGCNYFKTFSYEKCLTFFEYCNKNIDENDINNKLIYYNNALILLVKRNNKNKNNYNNNNNNNNLDTIVRTLNKYISAKKKYFDNIYNNNNGENENGNNTLIINLKNHQNNYNSFKLLSFIMFNTCYAIEKYLNQKIYAKKLYENFYEYTCKYLGKNSFEAHKFLFRMDNDKKNMNNKNELMFYSINNENKVNGDEIKLRSRTPINIRKSNQKSNAYDNDINLRLKSIFEKIANFEEILKNKEIIDNIALTEKKQNYESSQDKQNIIPNKINFNYENNKNENNSYNNDNKKENNNKNNTTSNINKENKIKNEINNKNDNDIKKENNIKDNKNNDNKINEDNKEENKKTKTREKVTFEMMDNIIEEFKRESQEKLEQQKKLKEEKEKKMKEEKEKGKTNENNMKIKIDKVSDNPTESQPKKIPRIKKLFQKVLGTREKEPPKTMLGELFQSLMKNPEEKKKNTPEIGGKEIDFGKSSENNFINLDDD